jgi:hypothetical protein
METLDNSQPVPTTPLAPQAQLDEALRPELALGGPLDPAQIEGLKDFVTQNYAKQPFATADTEQILAEVAQIDSEAGYSPQLGARVLQSLRSNGVYPNGINTPDDIDRVAQTESDFQRIMAASVVKGYDTAITVPTLYQTLAGTEKHQEAVAAMLRANPVTILVHPAELKQGLSPEDFAKTVTAAYTAVITDPNRNFNSGLLSAELVDVIGKDKVRQQVLAGIEKDTFFGSYQSTADVVKIADLGVISPSEGMDLALSSYKNGTPGATVRAICEFAGRQADPELTLADIRAAVKDRLASPDTKTEDVEQTLADIVSYRMDQYFSPTDVTEAVATAEAVHGEAVLFSNASQFIPALGEAKVTQIYQDAIEKLSTTADNAERLKLAKSLLYSGGQLDEQQRITVAGTIAEVSPEDFVSFIAGKHYTDSGEKYQAFVHETTRKLIPAMSADVLFSHLRDISQEFPDDAQFIEEAVLSRAHELKNINVLNEYYLRETLPTEKMQEIAQNLLANNQEASSYELERIFSYSAEQFGVDTAKNMFAGIISTNPDFALQMITRHITSYSETELSDITNQLVANGQSGRLIYGLKDLAYHLPAEQTIAIVTDTIQNLPHLGVAALKNIEGAIQHSTVKALAQQLMESNPAALLLEWDTLPKGLIESKDHVIEFMMADPRTALAPKYFKRLIKRLPAADGSTAFQIMVREATATYSRIDRILAKPGASEMLERIRGGFANSSERSELDAIAYAGMISDNQGPEFTPMANISSLQDAKQSLVAILNNATGSKIETIGESVNALESKMGNLVPTAIYSLLERHIRPENTAYIGNVIDAVAANNYRQWKYGDREQFIADGVLPNVSEAQYAAWQRNESVKSTEIVVGGAENVATHIQRVMVQNAPLIKGLEKLSEVADPKALTNDAKQDISAIGQQIANIHRAKANNEISADQASQEVAALQTQKTDLEYVVNVLRLTNISPEEVAANRIFNDAGKPTKVTLDAVLNQVVEKNGQIGLDALGQIQTVLDDFRDETDTDIGEVTIGDTDDFQTTIEIGANPVGSCQHYDQGMFKQGLVGYFDPGVKIITAHNQRGRFIARAAARLVSDSKGQPVMVLEPTYTSQASEDINNAIMQRAKAKAEAMGIPVFVMDTSGADTFVKDGQVFISGQRAPYMYSDVFGGVREKTITAPTANSRRLKAI